MARAIAVALLIQFPASVLADTTQYWVAKDAVSEQCEVVTKKPDGTLVIELAKTIFKTEAEAKGVIFAGSSSAEVLPPAANAVPVIIAIAIAPCKAS